MHARYTASGACTHVHRQLGDVGRGLRSSALLPAPASAAPLALIKSSSEGGEEVLGVKATRRGTHIANVHGGFVWRWWRVSWEVAADD